MDLFDVNSVADLFEDNDEEYFLGGIDDHPTSTTARDGPGLKLIEKDYNLNSPLISDDIDEALSFLRTKALSTRYQSATKFTSNFGLLSSLPLNWKEWKGAEGFHQWMGRKVFQGSSGEMGVVRWLHDIYGSANPAIRIMNTFLKAIIPEINLRGSAEIVKKSFFDSVRSDRARKDLGWFILLHLIVCLMNSANAEERMNLNSIIPDLPIKVEELEGNNFQAEHSHPILGHIIVVPGHVLFFRDQRILDRNMTLMLKDVIISRFSSKACLVNRSDNKYPRDSVEKVEQLYLAGDKVLQSHGEQAYDGIKLLESFCNARFSSLGHKYRPHLEEDLKLQTHLGKKVAELKNGPGIDMSEVASLVETENDVSMVSIYYGSFRHWGHPFIDYLEGLRQLHHQVTVDKIIDHEYVRCLASDFVKLVLHKQFYQKGRWFVDKDRLVEIDPHHSFIPFIENCWPSEDTIREFGDHWDSLPIIPCFEVPDQIDPSVLYDDKSFSMQRSEVLKHIRSGNQSPIKSLKVLVEAIKKEHQNVKAFLALINEHGLDLEDLVIALKAKERELKRLGRFFTMMSWNLRKYFVITEHLIKTFYVPMFEGLTMADNLNEVIKKMLASSSGQGLSDYENVTYSIHMDYSKWNNHQRYESTAPIFRAMGKFFGMDEIFAKTHLFFQKSLVYYAGRPDLMRLDGEGNPMSLGEDIGMVSQGVWRD